MDRRQILIGAASGALSLAAKPAFAQGGEVAIGIIYPMSGASAQIGVDARHANETALEIINKAHALDLPVAKEAGLSGLGGAKLRLVFADHQPTRRRGAPRPSA